MKYTKGARNSYYNDVKLKKKVIIIMYNFHQNQSLKFCMLIKKNNK